MNLLQKFVMDKDLDKSPIMNSNFLINFATIARRLCLDPKAKERIGGYILSQQFCYPEMIEKEFLPYLIDKVEVICVFLFLL